MYPRRRRPASVLTAHLIKRLRPNMALPITLVNMCSKEEGTRDERPWQHRIATSQDLSKCSAEMVRKLSPSPLDLVPDCLTGEERIAEHSFEIRQMVLRGIGSVLVARREIVHCVGSYSEPRGTRAPAVKDFISESSLGCGEWMVTEARGDHCTGSSNTTIQYCIDCKIIPTKIRPNPATPSRK